MRFSVIALFFLTACVEDQVLTPPNPDLPRHTCGADGYLNLVGQSANILAAMTFPAPVRIIKPGTPITEDYSEQRLNIIVDKKNKISDFYCG